MLNNYYNALMTMQQTQNRIANDISDIESEFNERFK